MRPKQLKIPIYLEIKEFLSSNFEIVFDRHFGLTLVNGQPIDDNLYTLLFDTFVQVHDKGTSDNYFQKAIHAVALQNNQHWWQDWLNALPPWDGIDRMLTLAELLVGGDESLGLYAVFLKKWLLGSLAKADDKNALVKTMLILAGQQDIGKSTFLRELTPEPPFAHSTFNDSVHITMLAQKPADFWSNIAGCIITEFAELVGNRKEHADALKNALSTRCPKGRVAYGRFHREIPVTTIFSGSTNRTDGFLKDTTGNVRFMVIPCKEFSIGEGIKTAAVADARQQIWAQIKHAHQNGEPHWIESSEIKREQAKQNLGHIYLDEVSEQIVDYIESKKPDALRYNDPLDSPIRNARLHQIQAAMAHCGWVKAHKFCFKKDGEVINAPQCWISPDVQTCGGRYPLDEAPRADIARYIVEELGMTITKKSMKGVLRELPKKKRRKTK